MIMVGSGDVVSSCAAWALISADSSRGLFGFASFYWLFFLFLWELVDDFIAAHKAEIFASDAFEEATVGCESYDLALKFFIIGPAVGQALFDFILVLFKFKNAQEPFITKNSEKENECQASSRNEIHLF